jgi:hypothetical protein
LYGIFGRFYNVEAHPESLSLSVVVVGFEQNGPWAPDLYLTQLEDMLTRAHAALKARICNLVGRPSAHHERSFSYI